MKTPDEKALKKFRELIRKQDTSARISFLAKQFFFGNHEMPLLPNSPFIICQNAKNRNKLSLRMIFAKDAVVGYHQIDISVAFSQLERIRLIDAHTSVPPAIIFTLTRAGFDIILKHLPGLKDKVEKSMQGSADSRDMMFFLREIPEPQSGAHMKYSFNDNGVSISRVLGFKEAKVVLMEDIAAVDKQHHVEKVTQFKGGPTIQREELFKEVDPAKFLMHLKDRGIEEVSKYREGRVFRVRKNPRIKPHISVNSEEYSKGNAVGISFAKPNAQFVEESTRIDKVFRKRKMDENLSKNLHWVNREGFVSSDLDCAQENQYPEGGGNNGIYDLFMDQNNCENGGLVFQRKSCDEMEYQPTIHSSNGGIHSSFYPIQGDISAVTHGISQIGMNYQDWNMGIPQYGVDGHQGYGSLYDMTAYGNPMHQGDNAFSPEPEEPEYDSPPRPPVERVDINGKLASFHGVELYPKDLKTLDRKEFVNDNVIEFMSKHIQSEMDEELKKRGHFFSTFFYNSILVHTKLPSLCFSQRRPITPESDELLNIKASGIFRWTRQINLFEKEYIIIPINEDLHWVLLVIINPAGVIIDKRRQKISRRAPKAKFLFFDPLSGLDPSRCNHMCYIVKKWLAEVYLLHYTKDKKFDLGPNKIFDESRIEIIIPKNIPIQNNFYDCGLYVVHYIEGLLCSPSGPILLKELPTLDWAEKWPQAEKMCELMRDKVYHLMVNACGEEARSRLAQYERVNRCGLSREKAMKKYRRHSAVPFRYTKRHPEYYARHYSVNTPARNVINDDPMFANPRGMALMPITRRVRSLRLPEENFPIAY